MPVVTVWSSPSGAPMAMTWSPTTTLSDCPELQRREVGALDLEDREVVARVTPDDGGLLGVAVAQHDLDVAVDAGLDDVVVGEHVPLAVDDEAGARRRSLAAGVDLDRDDAGQRHGGDVGDRAGWALRGARPGFRQRRAGEVDAVLRELTGDAADDTGEQAQADHEQRPACRGRAEARREHR